MVVLASTESIQTLDLRDYLGVLWRRKTIVVLALLVVAISAFLLSDRQQKVYRASSSMLLNLDKIDDSAISTQLSVLQSDAVRELAKANVPNLPSVSGGRDATSRIISASVQSPDPKLAAKAVDAYVNAYIEFSTTQQANALQHTIDQINAKIGQLQPQLDEANLDYTTQQASILDEFAPVAGESPTRATERAQQRSAA